jgi:hypothetical protein
VFLRSHLSLFCLASGSLDNIVGTR